MNNKWKVTILGLLIALPVYASFVVPNNTITTAKIVSQAVTQTKLAPRPSSSASPVPVGSIGVSATSGSVSITATSDTLVTNMSMAITTSGRPVFIGFISDGASNGGIACTTTSNCFFNIYRGNTVISEALVTSNGPPAAFTPIGSLYTIDFPTAGTYVYSLKASVSNGANPATFAYGKMVVYEL